MPWYLICLFALGGPVVPYGIVRLAVEWHLAGRGEVKMVGGETIFLPGNGHHTPDENA